MSARPWVVALFALGACLVARLAWAQQPAANAFGNDAPAAGDRLSEDQTDHRKREANFWRTEVASADFAYCYGEAGSRYNRDITDAAARVLSAITKIESRKRARSEVTRRERELEAAELDVKFAITARDASVARGGQSPTDVQRGEIAEAEKKLQQVTETRDEARRSLDVAKAAVAEAAPEQPNALDAAAKDLDVLTSLRLVAGIDQGKFEALVRDEARGKACLEIRERWLNARDELADDTRIANSHAEASFHADLFRKGSDLATAGDTANAFLEKPGAPDRIVFALMGALGAESRTDGTRLVMTLNLANLWAPDTKERMELPAVARHLFFQANLPFNATDDTPAIGRVAEEPAPDGVAAEVKRFTLKLGGSFADDTDTRLNNAACYQLAWVARPSRLDLDDSAAATPERSQLMDVCDHMAAEEQRVAWRVGVELASAEGSTYAERVAGALVWGPTSFLYINALAAHVIEPEKVTSLGGGASLGFNVGGDYGGADAWLRLGVDAFIAAVHHPERDNKFDVEARVAAVVKGKFFDTGVASVAVGPRIAGSTANEPELLATVALTWDADALIDGMLAPEPATTAGMK